MDYTKNILRGGGVNGVANLYREDSLLLVIAKDDFIRK